MAQPPQVTIEVQLRTLQPATAQRALAQQVELNRFGPQAGQVRNLNLIIPVLTGPNQYLQASIPGSALQALLQQAHQCPEGERSAFIQEWIMRNQQAILTEYARRGRITTPFTINIPVSVLSGVTPTLVAHPPVPAPAPSPLGRVVPRLPDQQVAVQEDAAEAPVPAPPPALRSRSPTPLPREVRSGDGSRTRPYEIHLGNTTPGREGIANEVVELPLRLDVDTVGTIYLTVHVQLSRLADSALQETRGELWRIITAAINRYAADHNIRPERSAIQHAQRNYNLAFVRALDRVRDTDHDVLEYLRSH